MMPHVIDVSMRGGQREAPARAIPTGLAGTLFAVLHQRPPQAPKVLINEEIDIAFNVIYPYLPNK